MSTLIVGNGGREHAIGLAIHNELPNEELTFSQINAGIEELGDNLDTKDTDDIVRKAALHGVDLMVVGPELPLVDGLADKSRNAGILTLGPGRRGAILEASKGHAHYFMKKAGILQPKSEVILNPELAKMRVRVNPDLVIKADGLAGGKGVILPKSRDEAVDVLDRMMCGYRVEGKAERQYMFGEAGKTVVLQERLSGPEVSMFALIDGTKAKVLLLAQDHKRLKDGDEGENTGGMGAYSPLPKSVVNDDQRQGMLDTLERTMAQLEKEKIDYRGTLYLGFMLAEQYDDKPVMMEYNVRFGDPEAQVVLPLLQAGGESVYELFYEAASGGFDGDTIQEVARKSGHAALTICLAAQGYPEAPRRGDTIYGLDKSYEGVTVYHGGTKREADDSVITNGGRVLYLTGIGNTIDAAAQNAYAAIGQSADSNGVYFEGMQYRTDIGHQVRTA